MPLRKRRSERDFAWQIGDRLMGSIGRDDPVPDGWTRSGLCLIYRICDGTEDESMVEAFVHSALPPDWKPNRSAHGHRNV